MTTAHNLKRLQNWIWILIYAGLMTLVLGLFTQRIDPELGVCLMIGGGVVAAVGVILIYWRSKLKESP